MTYVSSMVQKYHFTLRERTGSRVSPRYFLPGEQISILGDSLTSIRLEGPERTAHQQEELSRSQRLITNHGPPPNLQGDLLGKRFVSSNSGNMPRSDAEMDCDDGLPSPSIMLKYFTLHKHVIA